MTDFSERMAKRLRDRTKRNDLRDAKFVEVQRLRREAGPGLWAAVKSDLAFEIKSLNLEMGKELVVIEVTPGSEISLRADLDGDHRHLRAEYNADLGQLIWKNKNGLTETFEVSTGISGAPSFYSGIAPYNSRSIATSMLETLLEE